MILTETEKYHQLKVEVQTWARKGVRNHKKLTAKILEEGWKDSKDNILRLIIRELSYPNSMCPLKYERPATYNACFFDQLVVITSFPCSI